MKINKLTKHIAITFISMLTASTSLQAQEKSAKYAHIKFPGEITSIDIVNNTGYAGGEKMIWRFNPKDMTFEPVVDISDKGLFTDIQGFASRGQDLYYYVAGEGVYHLSPDGRSELVRERNDNFVKHYEETYSRMGVDPTNKYLLLYGWKENAVVFDIDHDMKPIVVFNDYVKDAYWLNNILWAGCLEKAVANKRTGKSMDNQDFIYYDSNDQHGLTKFMVSDPGKLPNFGEGVIPVPGMGEVVRLIYNKANGDLLLCLSSNDSAEIFKLTETDVTPVAKLKGSNTFRDFAAFGNKIVATTAGGLVNATYPHDGEQQVTPQVIKTDLMKPKMWEGQKPTPYEIGNIQFMEFDKDGNLWLGNNNDLFVIYK